MEMEGEYHKEETAVTIRRDCPGPSGDEPSISWHLAFC